MGAEKRTVFWGFASLLAILFIFSNSIKSGADSMAQSDVIVASVESIWSSANERESLPEETHLNLSVLVRKMAHFIEFSVLGAYAAPKVHADRTPWCMTNAEMVHRFR